jgi:hypothetical protein
MPDLVRERQQRFELVRNRCAAGIPLDFLDKLFVSTKMIGRDRAVDRVSKEAIVLR